MRQAKPMRNRRRTGRNSRGSYLINPDGSSASTPSRKRVPLRHRLRYHEEISASVGQQIFGSIMGGAGALATLLLGFRLQGALRMSVFEVVIASTIAAVGSFVGIYAVRSYH